MYNTPEEIGAVDVRTRNAKNGVCPLDSNTLVPTANLPVIPLANIPTPLTGKDADTVDTFHASQTPTASYVLAAGSDGTMPIKPIWDKLVSGSAVTSVTTNGEVTLDGNTHGGYAFEFIIYNPTGGAIVPRLYFENDTTNTNYYFTDTAGGVWGNDAILGPTGGIPTTGEMRMAGIIVISPRGHLSSTGERAFAHPTHEANIWAHHKTATVTNITRVDIVSSVASGIGINSRFRLWRRK